MKRDSSNCSDPLDAAVLADYWLGILPAPDEETVEEHLFDCDFCGDRLRETIALAEGLRRLASSGALRMTVSRSFISRAIETGAHVRQYYPSPGDTVECTVTAEDDFLIAHLAADLSGVARLDLSLSDTAGNELYRLSDIPIATDTSSVIYHESMTFAKGAASKSLVIRLIPHDASGREQAPHQYIFQHTRSLPGPGEW